MEFNVRQSGLAVPVSKPEPPPRKYGPLEIQDPERRDVARKALLALWDAMDLSASTAICLPGCNARDAHYQVYRYVGEMLLGKDCPEKEQLC